jgi:hypothetical protein
VEVAEAQAEVIRKLPVFKHAMFGQLVWKCQKFRDCHCTLETGAEHRTMMDWRYKFPSAGRYRVVLMLRDPHVCVCVCVCVVCVCVCVCSVCVCVCVVCVCVCVCMCVYVGCGLCVRSGYVCVVCVYVYVCSVVSVCEHSVCVLQ